MINPDHIPTVGYEAGMIANAQSNNGFTLIELSIVLVIIGLIVGGVMVGRDLIKAAEIRAQIGQIEKYNQAVNTFRTKYGYLPGDIPASAAAGFGLAPRDGTASRGDGDGYIGGAYQSVTFQEGDLICSEASLFWNDLSTVNLIDGHYVGNDAYANNDNCNGGDLLPAQITTIVPAAEIGNNNIITVYGDSGEGANFYQIFNITGISGLDGIGRLNGGNGTPPGLTPVDALTIDTKIDDGQPLTGTVQARDTLSYEGHIPALDIPAAPANGVCVSNATGSPYNIDPANGGTVNACDLRFRLQ